MAFLTKRAILVGSSLSLLTVVLAFAIGSYIVPIIRTRAVMRELVAEGGGDYDAAIDRLGGPTHAVGRLTTYLRMPAWIAPHQDNAAYLLGFCGDAAVMPLVQALESEQVEVRRCAAIALSKVAMDARVIRGDSSVVKEAVPALVERLEDENSEVRQCAARALGCIGCKTADVVRALCQCASDADAKVRAGAALALGLLGPDEEARSILRNLLQDQSQQVRDAAQDAFTRWSHPTFPDQVKRATDVEREE